MTWDVKKAWIRSLRIDFKHQNCIRVYRFTDLAKYPDIYEREFVTYYQKRRKDVRKNPGDSYGFDRLGGGDDLTLDER